MTGAILKDVTIGNCRLILGDALALMPGLGPVDHIISGPAGRRRRLLPAPHFQKGAI